MSTQLFWRHYVDTTGTCEVLDHLRQRGLLDETLVIITADHGENLGDHGLLGHEFCVYDTLVHVPLVVRLPGVVPAGRISEDAVENRLIWSLIDTVFTEAGPMTADQLVASLQEPDLAGSAVFSELYKRPLQTDLWLKSPRLDLFARRLRCIQLNQMKYIWASDQTQELYNLAKDPQELINLKFVRPEDLAALSDLLTAKTAAFGAADAAEAPDFTDELKRRLRSLGYLD